MTSSSEAYGPTPRNPQNPSLTIPAFNPDVDVLTAALAYAAAGWYIGPATKGSKHPGTLLGDNWHSKTSRDPEVIVSWFAGTNHGVFLHAGRSGAVVADIDNPDKLPAVLAEAIATARPHSSPPVSTNHAGVTPCSPYRQVGRSATAPES